MQSPLRRLCHIAAELVLRLVHPRRIKEDDLCVLLCQDAQDTAARCLRLVAHNGNLLPNERVDQRGLTDIRPPDHGGKARFMPAHRAIPNSSIT